MMDHQRCECHDCTQTRWKMILHEIAAGYAKTNGSSIPPKRVKP